MPGNPSVPAVGRPRTPGDAGQSNSAGMTATTVRAVPFSRSAGRRCSGRRRTARPQAMAQTHGDRRRGRYGRRSPRGRRCAEHVEERAGDAGAAETFGSPSRSGSTRLADPRNTGGEWRAVPGNRACAPASAVRAERTGWWTRETPGERVPRYGCGRSRTPLMMLKIAVFAPIPSARVRIAVAVKPAAPGSVRAAYARHPAGSPSTYPPAFVRVLVNRCRGRRALDVEWPGRCASSRGIAAQSKLAVALALFKVERNLVVHVTERIGSQMLRSRRWPSQGSAVSCGALPFA